MQAILMVPTWLRDFEWRGFVMSHRYLSGCRRSKAIVSQSFLGSALCYNALSPDRLLLLS